MLVPCIALTFAASPQPAFYTKPDIHGSQVVFTCEGALWLGNLKDDRAIRLTRDSGFASDAKFSPNGRWIAFDAHYEGGNDVYVMSADGGEPKRLTYDPTQAQVMGWTPDGKDVVFRSHRSDKYGFSFRLFQVSRKGGIATPLPVPQGYFASINAKLGMAYVPISAEWTNWFRYHAGAKDDIWWTDLKGRFKQLTSGPWVNTTPTWCGDRLFYVSEKTGEMNLFEYSWSTGKSKQITHSKHLEVRYPSSDASRVVYQIGPGLGYYDVATHTTHRIDFNLYGDLQTTHEVRFALDKFIDSMSIGPTGKRVAIDSRGQIVTVPVKEGYMAVVEKSPGARAILPAWSPDGKHIAFCSDRTGEYEVWIANSSAPSKPKQLTHGLAAEPVSLTWSPDGVRLCVTDRIGRILLVNAATGALHAIATDHYTGAYDSGVPVAVFSPNGQFIAYQSQNANWYNQIFLYDIATKVTARASLPAINSTAPSFSSDGKFLLMLCDASLDPEMMPIYGKFFLDNTSVIRMVALSAKTPSPYLTKNDEEGGPVKKKKSAKVPALASVEFDPHGLSLRWIEPPIPPGRYLVAAMVNGDIYMVNLSKQPSVSGQNGPAHLMRFDGKTKKTTDLGLADGFQVSKDGSTLLVMRGPLPFLFKTAAPTAAPVAIPIAQYSLSTNLRAEWRQEFEETWRMLRDLFFDPGFRGVNMAALRAKYEAQLNFVGDRSDLVRIQKDLLSEMDTGHCFITDPTPATPPVPMGFLGARLSAVPGQPAARFKRIFIGDGYYGDRSPLDVPGIGVKQGDYLLAIDGQPIEQNKDPQSMLIGKAGQVVALTVNVVPSLAGSRTVILKTLTLAAELKLQYQDWVARQAQYVAKHSNGEIGYLHVPDMESRGAIGFTKGLLPNLYKQGTIYDFRYNTGGLISSLLLEDITAKPIEWWQTRYGGQWTRESWANWGYKVALANYGNFSDGELVLANWKRLKIGPIIGQTTGGGEVGSGGGLKLEDGGSVYVPSYGAYGGGKWLVEGHGVRPNIPVIEDPAEMMQGRDPQLDTAITVLEAEIKEKPVAKPKHPPFRTEKRFLKGAKSSGG